MTSALDADLLLMINDVARLVRTLADKRARRHGMTRAQWMILARLERLPGMSQNELAAVVEVEPITIARLIDRLEARGFVERRPDPNDRRMRRLHLLPAAKPILHEIHDYRAELSQIFTAGVDPARVEQLTSDLRRMKANLHLEPRDVAKAV